MSKLQLAEIHTKNDTVKKIKDKPQKIKFSTLDAKEFPDDVLKYDLVITNTETGKKYKGTFSNNGLKAIFLFKSLAKSTMDRIIETTN